MIAGTGGSSPQLGCATRTPSYPQARPATYTGGMDIRTPATRADIIPVGKQIGTREPATSTKENESERTATHIIYPQTAGGRWQVFSGYRHTRAYTHTRKGVNRTSCHTRHPATTARTRSGPR